jgi:hypothetical protein
MKRECCRGCGTVGLIDHDAMSPQRRQLEPLRGDTGKRRREILAERAVGGVYPRTLRRLMGLDVTRRAG